MNFSLKHISSISGLFAVTYLAFGLAVLPAHAQVTLTPLDSNVGADGTPGGANPYGSGQFAGFAGNSGSPGYDASNNLFTVNGPAFTGGMGGEIMGTDPTINYQGGDGGNGLQVGSNATATVNSGTFTGGIGGTANGTGLTLTGGYGGSGLSVLFATANVYSGTFTGGDSGTATGIGGLASEFGGAGINANEGSIVNVYGGTFTGGNGAIIPNGTNGYSEGGLINLGGELNVYGGTFNPGLAGYGIETYDGTTTLFGTNFFVNGVAASDGPITGSGTITGDFADNIGSSTFTYQVVGGTFDLNGSAPVPESSTTVSFGLLLALGLGGVMVARKKSANA